MATIGQLVSLILPELIGGNIDGHFNVSPPSFPPDMFGVAAYLLQQSGAYHRVVPIGTPPFSAPHSLKIDAALVAKWRAAAAEWAEKPFLPELVKFHWEKLIGAHATDVHTDLNQKKPFPEWWTSAFALMVIADEACADVGYRPNSSEGRQSWIENVVHVAVAQADARSKQALGHQHKWNHLNTITLYSNQDVLCVQPKARTPDVGCALRSISHNLALLPPKGQIQVNWQRPLASQTIDDQLPLNLLLIPFPYKIVDEAFIKGNVFDSDTDAKPWGWFQIEQTWLGKDPKPIVDFLAGLIETAHKSDQTIHGVVLPEYALNWDCYAKLAEHIRITWPDIEFLISGSSTNCNGDKGNFALCSFFDIGLDDRGDPQRTVIHTSRGKHHRWRLEANQIGRYGLSGRLGPLVDGLSLWEGIYLDQREIHINPMRSASLFTVMICEDLARSDPCHEPLKSIGPNLVFVLLMDGPQLTDRWSARYSMGLAEDPGSSVLTLTSRALVDRWNRECAVCEKKWSVGLWKDDQSQVTPLDSGPNCHALLLKLSGKRVKEMTLDGRSTKEAFAWRLLSDRPTRDVVAKEHWEKLNAALG